MGQHRECCALRGNGWGRKHSTVNYVFDYGRGRLFSYHQIIIDECLKRKIKIDSKWFNPMYRGSNCEKLNLTDIMDTDYYLYESYFNYDKMKIDDEFIYPEHNLTYLKECLLNLHSKNAKLINGKSIEEIFLIMQLIGF